MKALFLDRDGVINEEHHYVHKIEDFIFREGIFELLRVFVNRGYKLFVVTNQSGIARGYYSKEDFYKLTDFMQKELKKEGIEIEKVSFCPHLPSDNCACRKPKTGMVDDILKEYDIDLKNSWLIGDKQSDIDLAKNAGIAKAIAINIDNPVDSCYNFKNIKECAEFFKNSSELIN